MTDASQPSAPPPAQTEEASFPPADLAAFLSCCAGDWLSLRSRFSLGDAGETGPASSATGGLPGTAGEDPLLAADETRWHTSERTELSVTLLAASGQDRAQETPNFVAESDAGHGGALGAEASAGINTGDGAASRGIGGLAIQVKGQATVHRSFFHADGRFGSEPDPNAGSTGRWTLWPDGSLDLVMEQGERRLRERIWFTKPNLRLRSTVEQQAGGSPARASFSSEIRRVPRPPAATAPAATN